MTTFTCCVCGNEWKEPDAKLARQIKVASKVNQDGPYCELCRHLTMAERYASARGYKMLGEQLRENLRALKR